MLIRTVLWSSSLFKLQRVVIAVVVASVKYIIIHNYNQNNGNSNNKER